MSETSRLRRLFAGSWADRAIAFRALKRQIGGIVLFRIFGRIVNRANSPFLVTYRPDFDYDFRRFPQYHALYATWGAAGQFENRGDIGRLNLLYLNLMQVLREGVPGDAVEVGVYKGNTAKILKELLRGTGRRLFLFDTFTGFDHSDIAGVDASVRHTGFADTSLTSVRHFVGSDDTVFVPGYFPDSAVGVTLPQWVALLHIDCDLYAPMKAALEMFYPRMRRGALIALHDYASGHWPGATQAIDQFFSDKAETVVIMPDKSGTAVVRKV